MHVSIKRDEDCRQYTDKETYREVANEKSEFWQRILLEIQQKNSNCPSP